MDAQIKKGFIEFCTLLIISKQKSYATEIINTLQEADLIVVEGTIYPLLGRLKREELVTYEWEESKSGPPRKYFVLTDKGKQKLAKYKDSWKNLSKSINFLISKYE